MKLSDRGGVSILGHVQAELTGEKQSTSTGKQLTWRSESRCADRSSALWETRSKGGGKEKKVPQR